MLLNEIRRQRESIIALGRKFGARRVRIFGSVARGEEKVTSDIDFLVEFDRGYDLFEQRLPFTDELENLLHRHVEVVPEHELNRHIRDRVLSEAIEL